MDKVKDGYLTFKEYADKTGVTYESVRQLVQRHQKELKGKIHKIGRRKYLDHKAQDFLKERQNQKTNTPTTANTNIDEYLAKIEKLEQQVENLTAEKEEYRNKLELEKDTHIKDLQEHTRYSQYVTVFLSGTRKEKKKLRKQLMQNNDTEEN